MLHRVAREARIGAWSTAIVPGAGYGSLWSIAVSGKLRDGEVEEPFSVCGFPARRTEAAELVRVDFDFTDIVPYLVALKSYLQKDLEPFIITVVRLTEGAKV
jgi:hypothetical protein